MFAVVVGEAPWRSVCLRASRVVPQPAAPDA